MNQEDKELLSKDLYTRLPYGVIETQQVMKAQQVVFAKAQQVMKAQAKAKNTFNKRLSKPIAFILIAVLAITVCGADVLVENGKLHWFLVGMFLPMLVLHILHKKGLMEWINKDLID